MLSKNLRLRRSEIKELKSQKSKVIQGQYFGLIYQPSNFQARFGVIVSNKISLKSTERNKIKRLVYRAVKEILLQNKGLFLFLAKKSCVGASIEDIEREFSNFKNKLF